MSEQEDTREPEGLDAAGEVGAEDTISFSKESELKGGQTKGGQTKGGQTKGGQTKGGQTKEGQTKEGQTKEGQTKEGQTKEGQTKEGELKEGSGVELGSHMDKELDVEKVEKDKGVDNSADGFVGGENNIVDKENLSFEDRYTKLKEENPYLMGIGLWFGVLASLLSFVVGLVSGIEVLTIVIRFLLVFVFFFVFGILVYLLLKSLIPEIFELVAGLRGGGGSMLFEEEGEDLGGSIDYTIDEGSEALSSDVESDADGFVGGESQEDFKIREGRGLDISSGTKREDMLIPDDPELLAKAVKTAMNDE